MSYEQKYIKYKIKYLKLNLLQKKKNYMVVMRITNQFCGLMN